MSRARNHMDDNPAETLKVGTFSADFPPPPRASLRLPPDWLVNPFSELALMAHAPTEVEGFRSNVFVSHRRVPAKSANKVVLEARREIEAAGVDLTSSMSLGINLLDLNLLAGDPRTIRMPNRVFEFERSSPDGAMRSFHVQLVAVTETRNPRVSYLHQVTGSTSHRADLNEMRRIVHSAEFRADPFS